MSTRRPRGSVRELSPGRWEVTAPLPPDPVTRARRRKSEVVRGDRADADRRLRELLVEVDRGEHELNITPGTSYSDLIDRWLEVKEDEGIAPGTLARYTSSAGYLKAFLGDRLPADVTVEALEGLYGRLSRQGLAGATVRKVHQVARGVGDMAVRYNLVRSNPAAEAHPPRIVEEQRDAPSPAEVQKLIRVGRASNPVLAALLHVGAATGARRGELLGIKWGDIDGNVLRIKRTVVLKGNEVVERPSSRQKNHRRNVTLDAGTVSVLEGLRASAAACLGAGQGGSEAASGRTRATVAPSAYVFAPLPDGLKPYRPDSVTGWFSRLAERCGVDCNLYEATRHFHASELIAAGRDPRTVADRLGNDPRILLTRYAHLRPGKDEEAAETIGAILTA